MRYPKIPSEVRDGLARLGTLSDDQISQLSSSLKSAQATVSREAFVRRLPDIEGVSPEDLERIIWALMSLSSYLAVGEIDLNEFAEDICVSLAKTSVDAQVVARLRKILPDLLEIDSLRLRAKAVDLQVDHARGFQAARVLTDVRPVFGTHSPSEVKGVLVYHTLKIQYFEEEGSRELFISLDDRDIEELKAALNRAADKAKTLRSLIAEKLNLIDFGATNSDIS